MGEKKQNISGFSRKPTHTHVTCFGCHCVTCLRQQQRQGAEGVGGQRQRAAPLERHPERGLQRRHAQRARQGLEGTERLEHFQHSIC